MAADRKTYRRPPPTASRAEAIDVVRKGVGSCDTAQDLVHVAEVAAEKPEKRNLPAIEMGEINSGAEDRTIPVLRMLDLSPRRTTSSDPRSWIATSTAISMASRVVSSSALRKRGCPPSSRQPSLTFEPRGAEIECPLCMNVAPCAPLSAPVAALRGKDAAPLARRRARDSGKYPDRSRLRLVR